MTQVLNILVMGGLCSTQRDYLFTKKDGRYEVDFNKLVKLDLEDVSRKHNNDSEAIRTYMSAYWDTTEAPSHTNFHGTNIASWITYGGRGTPVTAAISKVFGNRTIYHAFLYEGESYHSFIAKWRNGEIQQLYDMPSVILGAPVLENTIPFILEEIEAIRALEFKQDAPTVTHYRQYDMVQINCTVEASISYTDDMSEAREMFRKGDVGIITRVINDKNGNPAMYVVHNTVTSQEATLLPSEMISINFGNMIDNHNTVSQGE